MSRLLVAVAAALILYIGYTMGQGHRAGDYNGDGTVTKQDASDIIDKLRTKE